MRPVFLLLLVLPLLSLAGASPSPSPSPSPAPTRVATIEASELSGFAENPAAVQRLLKAALRLTQRKLGYRYGSSEPKQGGMDCSGTVFHLLQKAGLKAVPRSSDGQYVWVLEAGLFHPVKGREFDAPEFAALKPGDLLFWAGTYKVERKVPVTHAMIYLGRATSDGQPLMVGASEGRTYRGEKYYGVSVFDFQLPRPGNPGRFIGYGAIPGLVP